MTDNTSATGGYVTSRPPEPADAEAVEVELQRQAVALSGLEPALVRPRWQPLPPIQPDAEVTWMAIGVVRVEADDHPYIVHRSGTLSPPSEAVVTTWDRPPQTVWDSTADPTLWDVAPGYDEMQRHVTLTVVGSFYGPEAEDCAGRVRDAMYIPQNWEPMAYLGIKLREIEDLNRQPEIMNQRFINRVDLRFSLRREIVRIYPIFDLAAARVNLRADTGSIRYVVVDPPRT